MTTFWFARYTVWGGHRWMRVLTVHARRNLCRSNKWISLPLSSRLLWLQLLVVNWWV